MWPFVDHVDSLARTGWCCAFPTPEVWSLSWTMESEVGIRPEILLGTLPRTWNIGTAEQCHWSWWKPHLNVGRCGKFPRCCKSAKKSWIRLDTVLLQSLLTLVRVWHPILVSVVWHTRGQVCDSVRACYVFWAGTRGKELQGTSGEEQQIFIKKNLYEKSDWGILHRTFESKNPKWVLDVLGKDWSITWRGDDTRQNRHVFGDQLRCLGDLEEMLGQGFRHVDCFLLDARQSYRNFMEFRMALARNIPLDPWPFGSCGVTTTRTNRSLCRGAKQWLWVTSLRLSDQNLSLHSLQILCWQRPSMAPEFVWYGSLSLRQNIPTEPRQSFYIFLNRCLSP